MNLRLLLLFLPVLLFVQCAKRNRITYEIPANYPEARKAQLNDIRSKGQKLYKEYCADCHGIFTKGKDKVPNFSNTQLDNYSAKFIRRDPANHSVAMKMNPEQLNEVITFLRFKKTSKTDTTKPRRRF